MAGARHRARYRFTRGDLFELTRVVQRPGLLKRGLFLAVFCLVLFAMLKLQGDLWPWQVNWAGLFRQPTIIAALGLLGLVLFFGHYLSVLMTMMSYRSFAVADKQVEVSLSGEEIDIDVEGIRSTLPWSKIMEMVELSDRVLLRISGSELLTLPRRGFESPQAYRAAIDYAKERIVNV